MYGNDFETPDQPGASALLDEVESAERDLHEAAGRTVAAGEAAQQDYFDAVIAADQKIELYFCRPVISISTSSSRVTPSVSAAAYR